MRPKMDWRTKRAFHAGLVALCTSCGLAGAATLYALVTGNDVDGRTAELFRAMAVSAAIVVGCMMYVWLRSADDRDRDPPEDPVEPRPSGLAGSLQARVAVRVRPTDTVR